MFHPQLGVLNYLLSFIGIGPLEWIYNQSTVIPSLVLVETWQWTPLVMAHRLGGLAAVPREPYESAEIDGRQCLAEVPVPHHADDRAVPDDCRHHPLHRCGEELRHHLCDDARRPWHGHRETINIYLYNTAFAYYDIGYASAMAVVFFIVIIALSFVLLMVLSRTQWNEMEDR